MATPRPPEPTDHTQGTHQLRPNNRTAGKDIPPTNSFALPEPLADGAPPVDGPQLPAQFGRYRMLKQLGEGGMGTVYLALDEELQRPVALKIIRARSASKPASLERFKREARMAAQLAHPNICRVYDAGTIDSVPYLTMEYIEGASLAQYLQGGGRVSQKRAAGLIFKLAQALKTAHQKGIIHRDIKPSNIMLRGNEPVLTDFGLARPISDADPRITQEGAILGTPTYMAPEQVRGDTDAIGPASDVYSLGVILYELLTGTVPFEGPTTVVLAQTLVTDPPPPSTRAAGIDPRLDAACMKMLAKDLNSRFASMAEVSAALTKYLQAAQTPTRGERNRSRPAPLPEEETDDTGIAPSELARFPRSTRRILAILGALAAVVVVLMVVALARRKPPADDTSSDTPPPPASRWVALFNGKDLTGWRSHRGTRWSVVNGCLVGDGPPGKLVSERHDFKDFEVRLEASVSERGSGGLAFRDQPSPPGEAPRAYEVLINVPPPPGQRGPLFTIPPGSVRPGEWFEVRVAARGHHFTLFLNGVKQADVEDRQKRFRSGGIALLHPGFQASLKVRKLDIRELLPTD